MMIMTFDERREEELRTIILEHKINGALREDGSINYAPISYNFLQEATMRAIGELLTLYVAGTVMK